MTSTNDGKDVKSYQTSGPKGKSYYIELYKFLEARLNEGSDAHERTKHLCEAWHSVHSLCKHSAPSTHTHLLYWLQRHTARAVLQTEWQTPKRKDDRKSLEDAIDFFIAQVAEASRDGASLPWEAQLVARGEWFKRVLDNPWDHPVLTLLLNPTGTPPTDDEVLTWLKQERGVTFVVRLHTLVGEKCDDIAVSLAAAVMDRARAALLPVADSEEQTEEPPEKAAPTFADKLKEEAGFTPDVWETLMDIEFVLLHKRDSNRCIALAKQTPLLDAYPLIERLQKRLEVSPREKRLWKNAREVAILIAQVVIARCMVVKSCVGAARTALYCCARLLARLLTSRLPAAADALGAQALTARHLHTLAQAVDKQLSSTNEDMKPYVCELYVRAITAGMNELERLKLKTEKEAEARSMEKSLASWFVQLGVVLSRSDRIACECILTAFSLHPSQKMYERIDAAPPLAPVVTDSNESKEVTIKSDFGSWANDSRSQTNLVKTSETLNMKQTKNQANVLSTAIFNEGEALGLTPELCQDIAVLLSGPRVKTLSWDMDRTLLLENCRAYCEVTHEGTRVLTRELKYLNIDPRQYQHLPEEKDDDENDPYYGIERGYEHLAILEEPEEIWEDANDAENTESASSIEKYYLAPRRKKKVKKVPIPSDEDSDPLSLMAEEKKRIQKKKERPHSKERSKEGKKKQDLIDPLDIDGSNQNRKQTKPKKEPKEKKERKKKEKVPKVIGGKRSSIAKLIGIKVAKTKKKSIDVTRVATSVTVSDYDSQSKNLLTSLNSKGNPSNVIYEESIPGVEGKCVESKPYSGMMKNQCPVMYNKIGNKCAPSHILGRPPNNLTGMQHRPQTPSTDHKPSQSNRSMNFNQKKYPEDVRANLSRLLDFRRQREELQREQTTTQQKNVPYTPLRKPAIMRPNIPLQSNISPKSVAIPEIPKSYINKEQAEKIAELIRVQKKANFKESVIQYASKTDFNKNTPMNCSMDSRNRAQHFSPSSMKITDIVNPSYDRLMAEIAEKQTRGQEVSKTAYSQYQPVHSQKSFQHSQKPVQRSLNVMTQGQKDFQNFLKEYDQNNYMATTHAIDMSSKLAKGVKNPIMPVSRVIPVIPNVPKPDPKSMQVPKPPMQKKPEPSLNTFSRLSYHKNKQNEMKNKTQSPKLSTYQEVSSELDEIIKEHQLAQMKVIQSKRENVDRLKPATVEELGNKCENSRSHPLLSNLLQNSASISNSLFYQNESPFKSNPVQQKSPAPQNTCLSEKDSHDLMNLLRQQNKLNNSPLRYSTNINSKPSTSTISKGPPVTNYNLTFEKPPSQYTKSSASSLETKIINVISNTLLQPGHHEINKSISVNIKSTSNTSTTKSVNCTAAQNIVKKNVPCKDFFEKKYIPESSKPEWQAVMCDLLRHKTPTRGPNALEVALNKSSFESAFEKSVKETSTFSQSQPVMEKNTETIKYKEKADHPKPVITSIQNIIITKKGLKLKNQVPKQQKDPSAVPINYSKQPTMNEKLQVQNTFETTKKPSQEIQRRHFTYAGPKHVDPFISGIPNSDYDLLEELMDDDLRKEIGELSSDDETYNAAAQSFLKSTKSNEKRVSVQFNKEFNEPVSKPGIDVRCLYKHQSSNEISQSVTPKTMSQCAHKIAQTTHERNSLKVQEKAVTKTLDANFSMASTSQSVPTQISTTSNAQNVAYNSVKTITNSQMMEPNVNISAVPQPAPLQSVVLVGQELVYGGYSSIQTPIHSVNNLVPNNYVAVNTTPTMTLYRTTQYTTPVVIGTSITVPVVNVSCAAIPVHPSGIDHVVQPSSAVTVKPETLLADIQVSKKACDSPTEINNRDRLTDCTQPNKLQEENKANETDCFQPNKLQDENKANERKGLSEVQDVAVSDNVDKALSQKTENNINVNTKDTVADMERLNKKRLAIINREIYHKCGEDTIPLTYSPLPMKIETDIEKLNFPKAISLIDTSLSCKKDKSDSEEEKLLTQIKNNLQDLSDAINEIPSPATPESNDSKENKSYSPVLCRRILLRSSNKIAPKPNAESVLSQTPPLKKSKAKVKSVVTDVATKACVKANHDKINEKETSAPMRASRRLSNKKHPVVTNEKKPLQHQCQTPNTKAKPSSTSKAKSKIPKKTVTQSLEYLDIESELQGSNISKLVIENKNNIENDGSKPTGCEDTSIHAEKVTKNIILKASKPRETSVSKHYSQPVPADIENKDTIPEISKQNSSLSEQSSQKTAIPTAKAKKCIILEASILKSIHSKQSAQKTAIPADKANKDVIPDVSMFQKTGDSEQSSQKIVIPADKTNEDVNSKASMPQKTGLSERFSQKKVDDQHIPETVKDMKNYEKYVPEHNTDYSFKYVAEKVDDQSIPESIKDIKIDEKYILEHSTNQKVNVEADLRVNSADKNSSNKVFSESHVDDNSDGINKGINNLCANISNPSCDKLEKNVTITNNDVSKLLLDKKKSAEIETVSVTSTEVITTNYNFQRTAEKCDTSYNKTINDENKTKLQEKDNIDLDMTVTSEELPKQKLSPTFGNIKTARRKPINADKKKGVKDSKNVFITKDDINMVNKNTKNKETPVAASNEIEISKKPELCIVTVNVEPTPETWLVNNTPKIIPEPEVTSSPHSEIPTAKNSAADIDDDVVIIDDNAITKPVVPLREHGNAKVLIEKHVNNETPALEKKNKAAATSHAKDETSVVKHGKNEATSSNVLSHRSDKAQTETNTVANPNPGAVNELSVIPQHIKDNIYIEHLPCNDPMKTRVRVSLPNGRKVIATVRDKVHVTYDTLFAHPSIREALLNEMNCKKRYVMNIQQIVTVDKTDPNKIISAQINKIESPVPLAPFETIDLLSDDEDSGSPKVIDASKQVFVTKYGKFAAPPMDKDLLIRHQNKLNQKTQILLKKVDAKPLSHVTKIDPKPNTQVKKIQTKLNKQIKKVAVDAKPESPKKIAESAISPLIPNQYVADLKNDIENKLASEASNTPMVIPEVVEIDDSSNDSLYQGKSAETITEENKIINDLKNVLLKELGVEVHNDKTQTAANLLQEEPSNDDDLEIVEETHRPKNINRRKVLKISAIPAGKSFPFDDLDEEEQLQITNRKCAIKLVRCDDQKKDADVKTQLSGQVVDDEPNTITEVINVFNYLDENIVETEERSSSPVIELFDVIASLGNKLPAHSTAVHQVTPPFCKANWHATKSMLRLQSVDNAAIVRSNDLKKDTKISDNLIDQAMPLSCAANWLTTKLTLYLQGIHDDSLVRNHPFESDKDISGDGVINKAMTLSCEANWLTTKPTIHSFHINDTALVRSRVQYYDDEMCDDRFVDEAIPLPCEANLFTTKPTIHLQSDNDTALVRSHAYDDEMCNDRFVDQAIPLSCEVNWLTSKPTLNLQVVNDTALVHEEMPLTCEADWLTTKSTLYLKEVDNELARSNDIEFDTKICNGILDYIVKPLSCEAQWFATKVSLHLGAARNALLMRSSISTDGNEKRSDRSSTSSVVILETIPIQTAPPSSGPSLVSLVLESFRDANVIHQYILLRNASTGSPSVNLKRKRKSLSLQSSTASKVSKLNVALELHFIGCNKLPTVAIDNPTSDLEKVSGHILQDIKMVSHLESSSDDKTVKSSVCATKCDDSYNMKVPVDGEEVLEIDSCRNKDIEATAVDSNTNIGNVNENYVLLESSNINEENVFSPSEDRSPSPVIDTNIILAFDNYASIQFDEHSSNDSPPLSPSITVAQSPQRGIGSNTYNYASEPSLETENIPDKQECINDIDDSSLICTSVEANKTENDSLVTECSIVSSTYEIEMHSNESSDSGDFDDLQVKLAEIVGESIDENNTKKSQNNKIVKISERRKSEIIRIILGDEPFVNTDSKNIGISVSQEEQIDAHILADEYLNTNDHEYSTGLGVASDVTDETDEDNHEVVYVSTEDMMFLSETNSTKELYEEIVDMRSDEIVDDLLFESTTNINTGESNLRKLSDQVSGSVNMGDNVPTTTYESCISEVAVKENIDEELHKKIQKKCQEATEDLFEATSDDFVMEVAVKEDHDDSLRKEKQKKCQEATEDLIADSVVVTKDSIKMEDKATKLFNDITADRTMSKYLALIRNKSEMLESIVEYEDPEDGTCYVFPIIEESSHDVEPIEHTEVVNEVSITESAEIREMKANTVNTGSTRQNDSSSQSKEANPHNGLSYDDIETKLAEIVGEPFAENKCEKTSTPKICLEEKYETFYIVEVEAVSSPEKGVEDVACQLKGTDDQDSQKTLVKSLEVKSVSDANKKIRSKYHDKSKDVSNTLAFNKNLKVKRPKHTYGNDAEQVKTRRKSLKRKMVMPDIKMSERKYQKGNQTRLVEIIGESFTENESKKTSTPEICLDEKYKTTYIVEVEAVSSPEKGGEDVARQLKVTDDQGSQKTSVKSLKAKSISVASKKGESKYHFEDVACQLRRNDDQDSQKTLSKYHHKFKNVGNIADTENLEVKLPKHTYSKVSGQINTRQRSLKRKTDMLETKMSERKYRKGKNIDYPRFTAAAISETVYAKEYKILIDYCSSVKFSFALPFHKEDIDVHDKLKSWPIANTHPQTIEQSVETNENLFIEIDKSEALLDPLEQTLPEEIISKFNENSYTPSNIHETNFNMGFGERSGRVIQESKDGEYTTFSAATLSDVKQLQPLLPSDEKVTLMRTNCIDNKVHDQKLKAMRFVDHLNLRDKVRMFFEKTKAELSFDWKLNHKKDDFENDSDNWPFGVFTSTRSFKPSPVEITVNVVQLGQLPVSTAAQNPITCDPRVTHVSNASPSQCSPGNSLGDELQTPIKTEYTELTTANITLPIMQEYVQHHSVPTELQEPTNLYGANDSTSLSTQIKSIVKIELMEETSQENVDYENNGMQQLPNGNVGNSVQYQFENIANNVASESDLISAAKSLKTPNTTATFREDKQSNDTVEKPDQLAHAMNAAGITTKGLTNTNHSIDTMHQNAPPNVVITSQANADNFSKSTPINAIALQQAFAQILPPPLNQTNTSENNSQTSTNPQVLHIVQGNHPQSVINKSNGTQLLHIVQNKSSINNNGTPTSQHNTFSGLSLVDGGIQQSGNQLLHIVNTANQKNTNAGQLLKRVNLLTNLTNVQGSNEQKMVQFVCKSADGKSIQLPHQRSMVLRLQPLDPSNVPTTLKQNENQDIGSASSTTHSINEKESSPQEMKSRSLYEENYAKFVQNDPKFAQNGDTNLEKATSLPKFNQVFGKQVYQDKQNDSANLPENEEPPEENNAPLEQINDITNPPMLIRKTNATQPAQVQPNLVQQIKQTIGPMNIQTMHGGVIYTRQIPVNIGNGQTINLITVPSTELVDDSAQKQQTDGKFGNQEGDPPIIKIVPTNQPAVTPNGSPDDNAPARSTNDANSQPNSQPQPVLTQMRIKLPMLSKAPQMVGGTRVVRPSFFQIQRNVIGGANQQVYQQLVLTAAPPLGQSIRLPAQVQKPKTPSETQSSPESQMSSSTLEQLREFDMVLEQVKERSTVQPGSSTSSANNLTKMKSSPNTTDAPTPSTSTQESPTQVLYSVGNTQPLNMVNYVSRKSTITSTTTSSFARSPDSAGTIGSPPSSTHSHLPHTVTSDSCASSCASEAAAATTVQPKPKKKKPKPSTSNSNPFNIKNTPKPSSQKPLEDEQTTQRILYILAEYKEQVENSPDKDKPAPRRRNNPAAPNSGSSKRKKSGSRRRDMSPVLGEDSCRTMGSEDSSCGTSLGECNECLETHSPEESPKKVVRRLTFEQETQVTQTRTTTTTTTIPQRNVIVTDGQAFAVRGAPGKPATTVLMPANYLLPVSMVKGGQQIAIVTNRGPKLLVGAGEAGTGGTLLFQRLIGPGGLKPMLARPGVRHIRLPTTALHNLQAFNIATPVAAHVQPPDSIASPAQAPTPPDLVDTRAMSSPWPDRDAGEAKPERGNSSPEGSEPWNLPSSSIADDYGYEEIVRTDNMDRTVLDAIPDRYSPDLEAQRIFDKMFDSDSKKSMYDSRCGYDIDASDDDKAYHQVVHRKDGRHTRLTHVSAAALRHKYAILEHELRLQKSLSEECEDLGVDSPSASELFPEAELLFAPSPAHEQTIEQCHTPQPTIHAQGIPQPDLDDQIATDQLLTHRERHDDLDINLDDVGEIVTVGEDGMTTIPLDHEEFARSHEEFARSHPNTTFHSEPEDGEVPPFTIAQGVKGRQITFHSRGIPATVVMAPQSTVISQATVEATGTQNPVKFSDIDNMINAMPSQQHAHINMPSVLKENEGLTKFDRLLNESRELNLSNSASAIVHSIGNGTQVIRRVQYERRDSRYLVEEDAMIAGDSKTDERRDMMDDTSSSERHPELFWDTQSRHERRRFDFSSDSDKCCKSPYDETTSDSSGIGAHMRLDSVIKAARTERRRSDGSSAEDSHPPLRTYPPKRAHQHTHHAHHHDVDRSMTGKTRASDRCHDVKDESRRRASNRGVVKRGCHCCNGSTPPKPKKARPKKSSEYPHN